MIKEEEQKRKIDAIEQEEHARQYNPINIEVARQFAAKIKPSLEQQEISKRIFDSAGNEIHISVRFSGEYGGGKLKQLMSTPCCESLKWPSSAAWGKIVSTHT